MNSVEDKMTCASPIEGIGAGWETYADFDRSLFVAHDGTPLVVYEYGPSAAPPVVIVNPIGVPILLSSRLMRRLGERHRVICWEQRGCRAESSANANDYGAFLADFVQIAQARARGRCAFVGVCSGASLVLKAVANELVDATAIVLASPSVPFALDYSPSLFDKAVVPYMRMIANGDRTLANSLMEIKNTTAAQASVQTDESVIDSADRWSLRSIESLMVYARTIGTFSDQKLERDFARIKHDVLIVAAADDQTVSIATVRALARHLPNARLDERASGGHFVLFLDARVQEAICDALSREMRSDQSNRPAA